MSLLEKLKRECKPFEFLVIRTDDAGNLLMTNDPDKPLMVSL